MSSKVCIKLSADIDSWGFACSVLHHEEQFGHDLYDVPRLKDEVSLPLDSFWGEAARNVGLTPDLTSWWWLKSIVFS